MNNNSMKSERVKAVEEMIEKTGRFGRAVQNISAFSGYDTEGDFAFQPVVRITLSTPKIGRYVIAIDQAKTLANDLADAIKDAEAYASRMAAKLYAESEHAHYKTASDSTANDRWIIQRRVEE